MVDKIILKVGEKVNDELDESKKHQTDAYHECLEILKNIGFEKERITSSHETWRHPTRVYKNNGYGMTVSLGRGIDYSINMIKDIARAGQFQKEILIPAKHHKFSDEEMNQFSKLKPIDIEQKIRGKNGN